MPRSLPGIVLAFVAAAFDVTAASLGWEHVRPFSKPLPAVILAVSALLSGRNRILGVGLLLAAVGDEALLNASSDAFLSGMAAFAAMHVCYILAYRSSGVAAPRDRLTWVYAALCLVAVAGANLLLDPHAGPFAIPLAIYSLLLAAMAWSAFDVHNRVRPGSIAIALGGAAFMLSDTTLAFAKFYPGFSLGGRAAELAIVGTYFVAQLLIASGMLRANATAS